MDIIIAGVVGILTLGIGFVGAYFGGVLAWCAAERSWVEIILPRKQWIIVWVALGFLSGFGGGLLGAELATVEVSVVLESRD